jgi:hypothetical protein
MIDLVNLGNSMALLPNDNIISDHIIRLQQLHCRLKTNKQTYRQTSYFGTKKKTFKFTNRQN